jgi:hypothetical protein
LRGIFGLVPLAIWRRTSYRFVKGDPQFLTRIKKAGPFPLIEEVESVAMSTTAASRSLTDGMGVGPLLGANDETVKSSGAPGTIAVDLLDTAYTNRLPNDPDARLPLNQCEDIDV